MVLFIHTLLYTHTVARKLFWCGLFLAKRNARTVLRRANRNFQNIKGWREHGSLFSFHYLSLPHPTPFSSRSLTYTLSSLYQCTYTALTPLVISQYIISYTDNNYICIIVRHNLRILTLVLVRILFIQSYSSIYCLC